MRRPGTPWNSNRGQSRSARRYSYQKTRDNRKHPIRGLWRRITNVTLVYLRHVLKAAKATS